MHTDSYTLTAIIIDISERKCCDVCSDKQELWEAETGSQFSFKEAGIVHFVKDDGCS